MKKKILIILCIIAAIGLIGFIVLKLMSKNAERHVETEKAVIISAKALALAFRTSEDSANKIYLNKTLQISGVVTGIDSNDNHQSILILENSGGINGVASTFKSILTGIQVGNMVQCKGICTGFLSNVTLSDCILISNTTGTTAVAVPVPKTVIPETEKKHADSIAVKPIKNYNTSKAQLTFDAGGGVEDIKAVNNQGEVTITGAGVIKCKVAVLGFTFSDALMQQHFNEEYLESGKYPTASFTGHINNIKEIDLEKDGTYSAEITGNLTMHGVTQRVNNTATLTIKSGRLSAQSKLDIKMADYKISTDATSSAVLTINCRF